MDNGFALPCYQNFEKTIKPLSYEAGMMMGKTLICLFSALNLFQMGCC